jgi:hypothetical protein
MKLVQIGRLLLLLFGYFLPTVQAWVSPPTKSFLIRPAASSTSTTTSSLNGWLDSLSPYESKIPEELKDQIYLAEGNTPAAKERGQRVGLYALVAFIGILFAFFNGFLTELRADGADGSPGVDLADSGFGWVLDNFLFSFLFTNKIGGAICLLGGAGSGLLAEAEFDTKRLNAEKIYEELERRRDSKTKKKLKKKTPVASTATGKKKRRPGKQAKRLVALSEVVLEDKEPTAAATSKELVEATTETETKETEEKKKEDKKGGVFGGIKDFYNQADSMAASQAMLLNKSLEDAGVVEKITDETGFKVIGREEAAKLKAQKEGDSTSTSTESKSEKQKEQ